MKWVMLIIVFAFGRVSGQNLDFLTFCGDTVPMYKESVKNRLKMALKRNEKGFNSPALQAKIQLYMPYVALVLKDHGLPDDLKFIPLSESRLQKHVVSPAGAVGMWQFMPATASGQGLTDMERRTVIKSTDAACRLLLKLYQQFKSWPLAVAAYNFGAGNVLKAIHRQKSTDYYALRLNDETANYLYQILSFKILYQQYFERNEAPPAVQQSLAIVPPVTGPDLSDSIVLPSSGIQITPSYDSIIVTAYVIKDTPIKSATIGLTLAVPLSADRQQLPVGTVFRGMIDDKRQIIVDGASMSPELNKYVGTATATGGSRNGRGAILPAGYKIILKFYQK